MTIEKLLGMSADELDKLTPAELEVYFAPYLAITRPVKKLVKQQDQKILTMSMSKRIQGNNPENFMKSLLRSKGIDPSKLGL